MYDEDIANISYSVWRLLQQMDTPEHFCDLYRINVNLEKTEEK